MGAFLPVIVSPWLLGGVLLLAPVMLMTTHKKPIKPAFYVSIFKYAKIRKMAKIKAEQRFFEIVRPVSDGYSPTTHARKTARKGKPCKLSKC